MEQRNLILAIVLSVAIMIGFQLLIERPRQQREQAAQQAQQQATQQQAAQQPAGSAPATAGQPSTAGQTSTAGQLPSVAPGATGLSRDTALKQSARVAIDTPALHGSIALTGGRLDDLLMEKYRETTDPNSPPVELFSPAGTSDAYFADFGWVGAAPGAKLPGADTLWQADGATLTPDKPVTLTWNNGEGLTFTRKFAVDDNYLFTVTQSVTNTGAQPVGLLPFGLVSRSGTPKTLGYYILHEGPIAVFNQRLSDGTSYKNLEESKEIDTTTSGGWLGFTDKYWLTAVIPPQSETVKARFDHSLQNATDQYQADYLGNEITVPAGGSATHETRLFAGAKEVHLLDSYRDKAGLPLFDRAVDFGWFYYLTKPIFYLLDFIYGYVGNFGISIMLLTVIVKSLFFPLQDRAYRSMNRLKQLQPEVQKLRDKYGEDKAKLNQEMMALYKRVGANPLGGCLPMVIQIPVFFSLYKVLFVTIEMRHAPFFGWIHDLSAPDPTSFANLFGLIPFTPPHFLMLGAWPIIMGCTQFLQQKMNPQMADPVQARMMMFLPVVFTFMLGSFPAGLVIYWAWNNSLSVLQQWVLLKRANRPTRA
ncbi:MAG TPA: membrane protein insertase YidC [Stellaceae bacterium]|nr:membrane protein insertase YidC [Stellaceae bacterium]